MQPIDCQYYSRLFSSEIRVALGEDACVTGRNGRMLPLSQALRRVAQAVPGITKFFTLRLPCDILSTLNQL
jgi:hypothetical protein